MWDWTDLLVVGIVIGVPVITGAGAVGFIVWTVRASPQYRRRLVLGLLSTAVSLFALGCCAAPFVPPSLCAVLALSVSALGIYLALIGFRTRDQVNPIWPCVACVVGITTNSLVFLIALTLLPQNSKHVIDRLEHSAGTLLGFICFAPFVSVLLIIGIRVWLWLSQNKTP